MGRGARQAAVHGATKSRTRVKQLSMHARTQTINVTFFKKDTFISVEHRKLSKICWWYYLTWQITDD